MNLTQRPRSNAPSTSASVKRPSLSTRQLVDLELGLYLLDRLRPDAPPTALPALLTDAPIRHSLTPQQHKYLHRARLVLARFTNPTHWQTLLDAYAAAPSDALAYDLCPRYSRFSEKTVGFARNRVGILRKMLS